MFDFLGEGKLNSDSIEKYSIKCLFWKDNVIIRRQSSYERDGALKRSEGVIPPLPPACGFAPIPGPILEESLDLTSCLLQATRYGWLKGRFKPNDPQMEVTHRVQLA